jgi:propionyl-CoA synthetase
VTLTLTLTLAFRSIKKEDPNGDLIKKHGIYCILFLIYCDLLYISFADISSLQALFLAGERADPDTIQWANRLLQVPVIDHWWMTGTLSSNY